ncbi:monooxygenase [Physcia stellaris]|nr:monooxygenase [Physcia stellaris]
MSTPESRSVEAKDEGRLAELGYTQELRRQWSLLHNFGASFSIISVITGITTLFSYGLNTGGPAAMSIGWLILSSWEQAWPKSYPQYLRRVDHTFGPTYWPPLTKHPSSHGSRDGEIGQECLVGLNANQSDRFNLIGQIAVTTGIDFGLAQLISTTAVVSNGYHATPVKTLGILAIILFSHAAVNFVSIHKLRYMIYTSILLNFGGVLCLVIAILAKAKTHQSAAFVFGKFFDGTGQDGPGWSVRASSFYVAVVGLLMAQFTITGFDSSTSNSRMMFAFARDGGIPHRLHIMNNRFKSPIRTVIFGATCSFLLALPALGSEVAFEGTVSIATIGLYISYGIPIAMTFCNPRNFKRGPFRLGRASKPIAMIACAWIAFTTVVFCLPTVNPVTQQSFNYTPVAVGIVGVFAFGSWFAWARFWFTGRCRNHCTICIRQLDFLGEGEGTEMGDHGEGDGGSDTRPVGTRRLHSSESRHELRGKGGAPSGHIAVDRDFEIQVVTYSGP